MDDLISRQALIRWVKTECNPYGKPTLDFESGKKVIEHLKQMPSAQHTAAWELDEQQEHVEKIYHCSNCGYRAWGEYEKTDFCGGCGAEMRGDTHE